MPSKNIPEDLGLPFIGNTLSYLRDTTGYLSRLYDQHGEISATRTMGIRWLAMLGPDALQAVFQNRDGAYANSGWEILIGKLFPRGLMLLDDEEHRLHRRILQAAFTREALAGYLGTMARRVEEGLDVWKTGEQFRFFDHIKALTLDVGAEVFAGQTPGPAAERVNRAFLDLVQAAGARLRLPLPGTSWRRGLRGRRLLETFFGGEIEPKRRAPTNDMLSHLCQARTESGALFDDEDIVNHMIFMLMAAHDTSAITLTGIVYYLAKYPEWQLRLREESLALGKAAPEHNDLERLEGAGLVMRETLRLMAPVPVIIRKVVRPTQFKGYELKPGDRLFISPWHAHHMAGYWCDPERFDPERFLPPRSEDRQHPFLWTPFGGGAHKCIGMHFGEMEVKLILHRMLLRYRWSVPDDYRMPISMVSLPIPMDGLPIRLETLCESVN